MLLVGAYRDNERTDAKKIEGEKHRVDVHHADLSGSRFDDVDLSGCDFHNVNMSGCDLNMSGWRVRNINLAGLIPRLVDQDPWAQLRRPMDMIRQG